eukprot:contig_18992_g4690
MTHLLAEPFIVAAHNVLPPSRIVGALLAPHFTGTVGINFLARQTLVSTVAPLTDATFSVGTGHALFLFAAAYKGWDFLGDNFVGGLARRGFTADASEDGLDNFTELTVGPDAFPTPSQRLPDAFPTPSRRLPDAFP